MIDSWIPKPIMGLLVFLIRAESGHFGKDLGTVNRIQNMCLMQLAVAGSVRQTLQLRPVTPPW